MRSQFPTLFRTSLAVLSVLLAVTGCTSLNRMQYQVLPPPSRPEFPTAITGADRTTIQEILRGTAAKLNMKDMTEVSLVPGTLVYYIERDVDYPIKLIAWEKDNSILIDFMHASGGVGESLEFREAREDLLSQLQKTFGTRLRVVPINKQVSPKS